MTAISQVGPHQVNILITMLYLMGQVIEVILELIELIFFGKIIVFSFGNKFNKFQPFSNCRSFIYTHEASWAKRCP